VGGEWRGPKGLSVKTARRFFRRRERKQATKLQRKSKGPTGGKGGKLCTASGPQKNLCTRQRNQPKGNPFPKKTPPLHGRAEPPGPKKKTKKRESGQHRQEWKDPQRKSPPTGARGSKGKLNLGGINLRIGGLWGIMGGRALTETEIPTPIKLKNAKRTGQKGEDTWVQKEKMNCFFLWVQEKN